VQDAGHGGGGDGIKIKSAGRILNTTAAFGRMRGCRKYAAVKPESINQSIVKHLAFLEGMLIDSMGLSNYLPTSIMQP